MNYTGLGEKSDTYEGRGGYQFYLSSNITKAENLNNLIYNEDWMYYGVIFILNLLS